MSTFSLDYAILHVLFVQDNCLVIAKLVPTINLKPEIFALVLWVNYFKMDYVNLIQKMGIGSEVLIPG